MKKLFAALLLSAFTFGTIVASANTVKVQQDTTKKTKKDTTKKEPKKPAQR
jgi:phage tail tape-measure protein